MDREQVIAKLREHEPELKASGIERLSLFGSVARGEARPDSDVDILVDLEPGKPSGSAMPLLWAHAEFLKLLVAREHGRPIELLQAVESRYAAASASQQASIYHWRNEVPVTELPQGRELLIEDRQPFTLHYGFDGWQRIADRAAAPLPFGLWGVRLTDAELAGAGQLDFTRCFPLGWENVDHRVSLAHQATTPCLRAAHS